MRTRITHVPCIIRIMYHVSQPFLPTWPFPPLFFSFRFSPSLPFFLFFFLFSFFFLFFFPPGPLFLTFFILFFVLFFVRRQTERVGSSLELELEMLARSFSSFTCTTTTDRRPSTTDQTRSSYPLFSPALPDLAFFPLFPLFDLPVGSPPLFVPSSVC